MKQLEGGGTKQDLARYRLEIASNDVKSAEILKEAGDYRGANNRTYYAIFHAINAVHALDEKAYRRHRDAIGNFNKDYVKTGIFPRELGRKISKIEEIRHASDYDDFYIAVKEETEEAVVTAKEFITEMKSYIAKRIKEDE